MRAPLTFGRTLGILAALLVAAACALAFALATGSVVVAPADVAAALLEGGQVRPPLRLLV